MAPKLVFYYIEKAIGFRGFGVPFYIKLGTFLSDWGPQDLIKLRQFLGLQDNRI